MIQTPSAAVAEQAYPVAHTEFDAVESTVDTAAPVGETVGLAVDRFVPPDIAAPVADTAEALVETAGRIVPVGNTVQVVAETVAVGAGTAPR